MCGSHGWQVTILREVTEVVGRGEGLHEPSVAERVFDEVMIEGSIGLHLDGEFLLDSFKERLRGFARLVVVSDRGAQAIEVMTVSVGAVGYYDCGGRDIDHLELACRSGVIEIKA